jgi:hypothetical protein
MRLRREEPSLMIDQETMLIKDIARVFMFEHWARFYHAVDKAGKTFLDVPDGVMEQCKAKHPDLAPLLEECAVQELTVESSCRTVGEFVLRLLDGTKYPPGKVLKALDSKAHKIETHMFNLWLKGHEGYLDANPQDFDGWLYMYQNWRMMDQVKAFTAKLESGQAAGEAQAGPAH